MNSIRLLAYKYSSTFRYDERGKEVVQGMSDLNVSYDGKVWVDLTTSLGAKHNDYGPNNELDL